MRLITISLLVLFGCTTQPEQLNLEQMRAEIVAIEKAFNDKAAAEGIKAAFLHFAHDSAAINRAGKIYKGKEAIATYFDQQTMRESKLTWQPEFVEVAEGGDMAYTYGPYQFSGISDSGDTVHYEGLFHTVWKRNEAGEWRFVYD